MTVTGLNKDEKTIVRRVADEHNSLLRYNIKNIINTISKYDVYDSKVLMKILYDLQEAHTIDIE